jgi:flagellin
MAIRISTNAGAVAANYHLGVNSTNLERSMARLASGTRINRPSDDAGGLAVSMKLRSAINRLSGAELNIQNGISFLEVQDGVLESIGNIIDRMSELKGLSRDVMKNAKDQQTYNREFKDLQLQLKDMISGTFNGVSLFAKYSTDNATGNVNKSEAVFDINGSQASRDHTIDVYTSADGSAGAKVSIHKALAWSALTFDSSDLEKKLNYFAAYQTSTNEGVNTSVYSGAENFASGAYRNVSTLEITSAATKGTISIGSLTEKDQLTFTLAAKDLNSTINLDNISVGVFLTAMENVAALRAQNGATMSRLEFQEVNLSRQRSNMEAALGRITDVDMGAESTRMAKYSVLRQASAAMLAQANTSPEVALMLIR